MDLVKRILPVLVAGVLTFPFVGCRDVETQREVSRLRDEVSSFDRAQREENKVLASKENREKGKHYFVESQSYLERGDLMGALSNLNQSKAHYAKAGMAFPLTYAEIRDSVANVLIEGPIKESFEVLEEQMARKDYCGSNETFASLILTHSRYFTDRGEFTKRLEEWREKKRPFWHEVLLCWAEGKLSKGDTSGARYYFMDAEDDAKERGAEFEDPLKYEILKTALFPERNSQN